ncbi:hypothetical protein PR048_019502 [Dryococelus australis]|uniref:Uncharacterized protein n=1 Tax=Dryococelus australis TaxID=614101 RepID=A0ABQ9H3M9_9NEOP|nr:hypothetical protein PR048_019502 [Dryococelus australis]
MRAAIDLAAIVLTQRSCSALLLCRTAVVRLLASHLGEPGSIPGGVTPGFSRVEIVLDDAAGRRVFSGISHFSRPFNPALPHTHLASALSALKTHISILPAMRSASSSSPVRLRYRPCLGVVSPGYFLESNHTNMAGSARPCTALHGSVSCLHIPGHAVAGQHFPLGPCWVGRWEGNDLSSFFLQVCEDSNTGCYKVVLSRGPERSDSRLQVAAILSGVYFLGVVPLTAKKCFACNRELRKYFHVPRSEIGIRICALSVRELCNPPNEHAPPRPKKFRGGAWRDFYSGNRGRCKPMFSHAPIGRKKSMGFRQCSTSAIPCKHNRTVRHAAAAYACIACMRYMYSVRRSKAPYLRRAITRKGRGNGPIAPLPHQGLKPAPLEEFQQQHPLSTSLSSLLIKYTQGGSYGPDRWPWLPNPSLPRCMSPCMISFPCRRKGFALSRNKIPPYPPGFHLTLSNRVATARWRYLSPLLHPTNSFSTPFLNLPTPLTDTNSSLNQFHSLTDLTSMDYLPFSVLLHTL